MSKASHSLFATLILLATLQAGQSMAQTVERSNGDANSQVSNTGNALTEPSTSLEAPVSRFKAATNKLTTSVNSMSASVVGGTESLIDNAMQLIGVRYRWGGNTPQSGLDCSGFVRYVFNDTFGFLLPRKSSQMSKVGLVVGKEELRPGDLVFFNTMRHAFSHVGIYVGDNKFIHAPSKGKTIRVDDMTKVYWEKRYNGARRMEGFEALNDEQRIQLLNDFQDRLDNTGKL
jgi:cell wall-associated NlpC family hydrolase